MNPETLVTTCPYVPSDSLTLYLSISLSLSLHLLSICRQGNLCDLSVDAVVNTTNERLNQRIGISAEIFKRAGPDLVAECLKTEGCHTGEAVLTKGCNLPAPHIIHTVGPRFSVKYQTAAENALHGCYRRCLEVLKENGLQSIAFPLVNTERKGYPKEPASHIAIRTVRRFLEKYGSSVHTLIFCVSSEEDLDIYNRVLPMYFPRSSAEEKKVQAILPEDTGNELGESVIQERQIRISAMPGFNDDDLPATTLIGASSVPAAASFYEVPESKDDFTTVQANPDEVRRQNDSDKPRSVQEREEAERRYQNYLRRAGEEDLTDLDKYNFLYTSGVDQMGRDVVIFVANRFPAETEDLDRLMLYMIKKLDPIVANDYTLLYFHTNILSGNKPPLSWLRQAYDIFSRNYKKNLKRLFIVHPSFFVKVVMWFVSPFISKKFWKKLRKVDKLTEVYEELDPQTVNIPDDILAYDQEVNKDDYLAEYDNTAADDGSAVAATDNGL